MAKFESMIELHHSEYKGKGITEKSKKEFQLINKWFEDWVWQFLEGNNEK